MGLLSPLGHWAGEGNLVPFAGLLAWTLVLFVTFDLYSPRLRSAEVQRLAESRAVARAEELNQLAEQNNQLMQELQEVLQQKALDDFGLSTMHEQARTVVPWKSSGEAVSPEASVTPSLLREPLLSNPRRLAALFSVVTTNTASSGCYAFSASTDADVSASGCLNSNRCPACFLATGLSSAATLRIGKCSSAYIGSSTQLSSQVLEYTFINTDTTYALTVEAHATSAFSGSAVSTKTVSTSLSTRALCYSGGSDYLYFQQT